MKKPLFNNFLGCMSLETGGKVIAWFSIVLGILGILGSILLVIISSWALSEISELDADYDIARATLIIVIVIYAIIAVYLVIYVAAAVFLLNGIKKRAHQKMIFMLVLLAIGVILDFLTLLGGGGAGQIVINLIAAAFAVYIFLTILSLYQKIKIENEQGGNTTDWTTTQPKTYV